MQKEITWSRRKIVLIRSANLLLVIVQKRKNELWTWFIYSNQHLPNSGTRSMICHRLFPQTYMQSWRKSSFYRILNSSSEVNTLVVPELIIDVHFSVWTWKIRRTDSKIWHERANMVLILLADIKLRRCGTDMACGPLVGTKQNYLSTIWPYD